MPAGAVGVIRGVKGGVAAAARDGGLDDELLRGPSPSRRLIAEWEERGVRDGDTALGENPEVSLVERRLDHRQRVRQNSDRGYVAGPGEVLLGTVESQVLRMRRSRTVTSPYAGRPTPRARPRRRTSSRAACNRGPSMSGYRSSGSAPAAERQHAMATGRASALNGDGVLARADRTGAEEARAPRTVRGPCGATRWCEHDGLGCSSRPRR